ncbi:MAG: DUF4785 family protein [Gammaproteobacteria bacterium]|nr:DUF4785 family protein [Gammaproteobacteria bacterium]
MKHLLNTLSLGLMLLPGLALSDTRSLSLPEGNDLAAELRGDVAMPLLNDERAPLSMSWALPPDQDLQAPAPAKAESRGYWLETTGEALNRGLNLATSAPGALLRINALAAPGERASPESLLVDPARLELLVGQTRYQGREAFALAARGEVDADSLILAGASAMRINPARGFGPFQLRSREPLPAARRYLVQVHEPASRLVLRAQAGSDAYVHGQTLSLSAELSQDAKTLAAKSAQGALLAPDGRRFDLKLERDAAGRWQAKLPLGMSAASAPGLWELELRTTGLVPRTLRSAVAIASPTARLGKELRLSSAAAGEPWRLSVPVRTALPGRYELTALVYGQDAAGQWRPAALSSSAAWLEGRGELVLKLEPSVLQQNGLRPPYALRELRLTDQSRLGLVQRQHLDLKLEQ